MVGQMPMGRVFGQVSFNPANECNRNLTTTTSKPRIFANALWPTVELRMESVAAVVAVVHATNLAVQAESHRLER